MLLIKAQYLSNWPERLLLTATHNLCMFLMATQKPSPHTAGCGAGMSLSFPVVRSELEVKLFKLSAEAHLQGKVLKLLVDEGR